MWYYCSMQLNCMKSLKKLSQIAEINSGHSFRSAINDEEEGDLYIIQAKNIKKNGKISDLKGLLKINSEELSTDLRLRHNDILLVARGYGQGSYRSAIYEDLGIPAVATSSVYVIRVNDPIILPEYLVFYLNSKKGQLEIQKILTGGSLVKMLLVKDLVNLKIPIPAIKKQRNIVNLSKNFYQYEKLVKRKKELMKQIIETQYN